MTLSDMGDPEFLHSNRYAANLLQEMAVIYRGAALPRIPTLLVAEQD